MASKKKARKSPAAKLRSDQRLSFAFHEKDSPTGVRRTTVKRFADLMNVSETRFLHLGAARLVQDLAERRAKAVVAKATGGNAMDDEPITDEQINAIHAMVPQENFIATSTYLDLLNEPD